MTAGNKPYKSMYLKLGGQHFLAKKHLLFNKSDIFLEISFLKRVFFYKNIVLLHRVLRNTLYIFAQSLSRTTTSNKKNKSNIKHSLELR